LNTVVSPEILYRHDYPYESSTTNTGRAHWNEFAQTVVKNLHLEKNDLVVDIGSNVGVLLEMFKSKGLRVLGVDPAPNIVMLAIKRGIDTICDFFNEESVEEILSSYGRAAVITGTNVFAHIDNLDIFLQNVKHLLKNRGTFIFEAPYFLRLLNNLEYDTIYHEHLSYFSVKPLIHFFMKHGMEIFNIEESDIHGGSFRVYVSEIGIHNVNKNVQAMLLHEEKEAIYSKERLDRFSLDVQRNRMELLWLLHSLKHENKSIVGVSAPAKGMTLLNYCRIGSHIIDVITEKSQLKINRYSPGQHIKIVHDDYLFEYNPDYALLLAWNFSNEIMHNLSEYMNRGGNFIIPIPYPKII
jgi:SAM-dependent methyltransferase